MSDERRPRHEPLLARALLRPFFSQDDATEILADLEELSAGRPPLRRALYFWSHLAGYSFRALFDGGRSRWLDGTRQDARHALRSLARSPGFTVATVSILALALGATTGMYSVVRGVLLEPLPLPDQDRLVSVWALEPSGDRSRMTPGNVRDVGTVGAFGSVAAFGGSSTSTRIGSVATSLSGGSVTPGYFETLGVRLTLGRTFSAQDADPGAEPVVILGHGLWRDAFGAHADALGSYIDLGGTEFTVIGVAPPGVYPTSVPVSTEMPFTSTNQDYFVPLRYAPEMWEQRRAHVLGTVARLEDGVTLASAAQALEALATSLQESFPEAHAHSFLASPFVEEVVGDVRLPLLATLTTMVLVLVIAFVNVGSLFVLRFQDHAGEIDVRRAVGAGWPQLVRRLVLESATVVGLATLGAMLVAHQTIRTAQRLVPYQIPRLEAVGLDTGAFALTTALATGLVLLFGLAPALRVSRPAANGRTRGYTRGTRERRLQRAVIALQAGLAVIVMVGASLLTRSFLALRSVDPGFAALETWAMRVEGTGDLDLLVERLRSVPGVATAARAYDHPLERNWTDGFSIRSRDPAREDANGAANLRAFGEGYFEAVGVRIAEGRIPDRGDFAAVRQVALVNEALRDRFFPDGGAVGAVLDVPSAARVGGDGANEFEIVGVVENVRFLGPDQPMEPAFYLPLSSFPVDANMLLVRPDGSGGDVMGGVQAFLRRDFPGMSIRSARQLGDVLSDLLARPRFNMMLVACFAGVALLLCALGSYWLVRRAVVSGLREIGIRMALGATRTSLVGAVMGEALVPMAVGVAAGFGVALNLTGLFGSLLFEISPTDPVSLVASPGLILLAGTVAAALPTVSALAVDPARTLRQD